MAHSTLPGWRLLPPEYGRVNADLSERRDLVAKHKEDILQGWWNKNAPQSTQGLMARLDVTRKRLEHVVGAAALDARWLQELKDETQRKMERLKALEEEAADCRNFVNEADAQLDLLRDIEVHNHSIKGRLKGTASSESSDSGESEESSATARGPRHRPLYPLETIAGGSGPRRNARTTRNCT